MQPRHVGGSTLGEFIRYFGRGKRASAIFAFSGIVALGAPTCVLAQARTEQGDFIGHERSLSVHFSIVSDQLSTTQLAEVIGRSSRHRFAFDSQERFSADDWYGTTATSNYDLHVWVVLNRPSAATLYFADPVADRFLIRNLRLSERLDEMDMESLAQAIKWSLSALSEGEVEAMTREQASELVKEREQFETKALRPDAEKERTTASNVENGSSPERRRIFRRPDQWFEIAGGYRISAHSPQIPIVHGPYARLGLDYHRGDQHFGVGFFGSYALPATYDQSSLSLRMSTLYVRIDLRAMFENDSGRVAFGPLLGAGIESSFLTPRAAEGSSLIVEDDSTDITGFVVVGVVGQLKLNYYLRFDWGLELDFDLRSVHYDIETAGAREVFVGRLPVRPSLRAGLSFF